MHVICIFTLCNNTNSSAVSVKLAEMQFRLFLNMPLSSCKFKYNKRNSSCLFLVSLCLCLNHKELNKKVIHDLSAGQSWKSQMRLGSRENNLWFYLLVASLVVLQPLRWCCVDCVIHHERYVREEQHHTYMWREQAIKEWSWHVNSIVSCCHSAKLCAYAARDFRSQHSISELCSTVRENFISQH